MWGGRFRGDLDPQIAAFTTSLPFDQRLYRADILASIAHATMLGHCGILLPAEADQIYRWRQQFARSDSFAPGVDRAARGGFGNNRE